MLTDRLRAPSKKSLSLSKALCRLKQLGEVGRAYDANAGAVALIERLEHRFRHYAGLEAEAGAFADTLRCVRHGAEFTAEANPGTLTRAWLDTAAACGVNRLSMGMQAAQDHLLRQLGRRHEPEDR